MLLVTAQSIDSLNESPYIIHIESEAEELLQGESNLWRMHMEFHLILSLSNALSSWIFRLDMGKMLRLRRVRDLYEHWANREVMVVEGIIEIHAQILIIQFWNCV